MAAFIPRPYMSVYSAFKSYVLLLTEALSYELKGSGVSATAIGPGPTRTNFMDEANAGKSLLFTGKFSNVMNPEDVAKIGYHAIMNRKSYVTVGLMNSLTLLLIRFLPRNLNTKLGALMNGK